MKVRVAALSLALTFAVGVVRAHAQGPPTAPGPAASLAARLAALEARVTALETLEESDIVGTYKWVTLGIELNRGFAGVPGTPARMSSSTSEVVFTLNADHSVQISTTGSVNCELPVLTFGIPACQPGEDDDPPGPATWSFANGVVTIAEDFKFALTASGAIVHGIGTEFLPGHTWSQIGVIVKLTN